MSFCDIVVYTSVICIIDVCARVHVWVYAGVSSS